MWWVRVCWGSVEGEFKWLEKSTCLVVPRIETVTSHVSSIYIISRIKSYTFPVENEIKACLLST